MGIYETSTISSTSEVWDPIKVLEMMNPDRATLTCVGYAPSCKRRCRNPINVNNRAKAYIILDVLSCMNPEVSNIRPLLEKLATATLCLAYHQGQVGGKVDSWMRTIDDIQFPTPIKARVSSFHSFQQNSDYRAYTKPVKTETKPHYSYTRNRREDWEEKSNERRHQENKKKAEQDQRERAARVQREQEKAEQDEKARQERNRREHERRKRQQQQEDAKAKREQELRDIAAKDRREWDAAWSRYVKGWEKFEIKKEDQDVVRSSLIRSHNTHSKQANKSEQVDFEDSIPWPVKSGRMKDLNSVEVTRFYRNAINPSLAATSKLTLMNDELRKWHLDRMLRLSGGIKPEEELLDLFKMVTRVAIEMRNEFKEKKNR
jgi:hypothetical protein